MKYFTTLLLSCLALTSVAQTTTIQVGSTTVSVTPLATGLTIPWELVWGPDNFIWMTERPGRISRLNPTTGQVLPLLTVPDVTPTGESGLLGMVLHPDFVNSPYVYIVYNYTEAGSLKQKLVRYTYSPSAGTLSSPLILVANIASVSTHSGSRLLILPDNTLLMTTGDAQNRPSAQDLTSLNGKVLRLNLDGSVPADNPLINGVRSLVYTFGHRNAQGLVRLPNGRIFSSEHGDVIEDEINLIEPGRNYGWPNVEGICNLPTEQTFCAANNVREPLLTWTPTVAPAGLRYYDSPAIPEWRGSLLLALLKDSRLKQLTIGANGDAITGQQDFLTNVFGRLRAVCISPAGRVYISTSNNAPGIDQVVVLENRAYTPTTTTTAPTRSLGLWPNPAQQTVTLRLPAAGPTAATAEIHDALGRRVRQAAFEVGQTDLTLDLAGLRAGVYVVRARSGTEQFTRRLVVQ